MAEQPFDLAAAAAAERGEPWQLAYGGRTFEIAADLPLDVLAAYASFAREQLAGEADDAGLRGAASMGPLLDSLGSLFASDDDYAAFRAMRPGQAELTALLSEIARRSGADLGEAQAPSSSSNGDGAQRRSISAVSTA